jgi:hypothetical protein
MACPRLDQQKRIGFNLSSIPNWTDLLLLLKEEGAPGY